MVPDRQKVRTDGRMDGRTDDAKTISLRLRRGIKSLNWALICMHDVTLECVVAETDHFADVFVCENVVCVDMKLCGRYDVRKLTLTQFCFEKPSARKGIFNV